MRGIASFVLAVVLLVATAVAAVAEPLRLRGVEYLGDLPTLVIDRRGYLEPTAFTIDYGGSGRANLALLRAGEVDVTSMGMTPLVLDWLNDPTPGGDDDPVVLANIAHSPTISHVVTLGEPTPDGPRRVGLPVGSNADMLWSLYAAYRGFDGAGVEVVDIAPPGVGDALAGRVIDAAVVWEPWTSRLRQRFGGELRALPTSAVYTARWLLVTRRDVARDRLASCRDLLRAYRRAETWIEGNPAAARALFVERWEIPAAALAELPMLPIFDVGLDWTVFTTFQQSLAWARRAGHGPGERTMSLFDVIDAGPLRQVAPTSVTLPQPSPGSRP